LQLEKPLLTVYRVGGGKDATVSGFIFRGEERAKTLDWSGFCAIRLRILSVEIAVRGLDMRFLGQNRGFWKTGEG
jgi:hypothetical protein